MRMWKTSGPELLPIGRSRCPNCQTRMVTAVVEEEPEGFEHRSFECSRCGHSEQNVFASDPMNTNAFGWLNSGLHPPK
jgi:Zn ribbon nucleic-acid-binding protein